MDTKPNIENPSVLFELSDNGNINIFLSISNETNINRIASFFNQVITGKTVQQDMLAILIKVVTQKLGESAAIELMYKLKSNFKNRDVIRPTQVIGLAATKGQSTIAPM